jgi:hypothetical protein
MTVSCSRSSFATARRRRASISTRPRIIRSSSPACATLPGTSSRRTSTIRCRAVRYTQEALFLRRGRLRIDFYDKDRTYVESRVIGPGDVILLISGGHGFEVLEEIEMVEVKQGPYAGEMDKTTFSGVSAAVARIVKGTGQES